MPPAQEPRGSRSRPGEGWTRRSVKGAREGGKKRPDPACGRMFHSLHPTALRRSSGARPARYQGCPRPLQRRCDEGEWSRGHLAAIGSSPCGQQRLNQDVVHLHLRPPRPERDWGPRPPRPGRIREAGRWPWRSAGASRAADGALRPRAGSGGAATCRRRHRARRVFSLLRVGPVGCGQRSVSEARSGSPQQVFRSPYVRFIHNVT